MRTLAVLAAMLSIAAFADPPTPPAHPEGDFRSIGGGLFVRRDDDLDKDDNGNIIIMVFSHRRIYAGPHYSLDGLELLGQSYDEATYDGGRLGQLHPEQVTLDCTHRTYKVIDIRYVVPREIWRRASTLPALAPVFRYVCKP